MAIAIVVSAGVSPALAQDLEVPGTTPELDQPNEIGQGTCSPESLAVDQVTTCTFPLIGATELPLLSPVTAYVVGQENLRSGRCVINGERLVCPDLPVGYDRGRLSIAVDALPDEVSLAEIAVDRTGDGVLGLVTVSMRVPPAFSGAPTTIQVFRASSLSPNATADLLLRREGDDTVVARVPALRSGEQYGFAEFVIPEPGRWTITGCQNGGGEECVKEGIRRPIHAIAPDPIPLVEGHNDVSADRINLVFVGSGFDDPTLPSLADEATRLLSLDGEPEAFSYDGATYGLGWGPFSVDPIRGNIDRFNFWYLDGDLPVVATLITPPDSDVDTVSVGPLGLGPDVILVGLTRNWSADGSRAHAELPSWADEMNLEPSDTPSLGSIYLPVLDDDPAVAGTLTHELGHALFGLRDEYDLFGTNVAEPGYPNCAIGEAQADTFWGDFRGQLDPMYGRWKKVSEANGVWYETDLTEDQFRVGMVEAHCGGDGIDTYRPTKRGLMNGEEPVFGTVNRHRAEQVLGLWPEPVVIPSTTTAAPTTSMVATSTSLPTTTSSTVSGGASGPVNETGESTGSGSVPLVVAGAAAVALGAVAVALMRARAQS